MYLDGTALVDPTGECTLARAYLLRADLPDPRSAPLNPDPGEVTCVAQFVFYNTPTFLSAKTDVSFIFYLSCEGQAPPALADAAPTFTMHLLDPQGNELGDGAVAQEAPLECLDDAIGLLGDYPGSVSGTFRNVTLDPTVQQGLTFQVDVLAPAALAHWMIDNMSILTGNRDHRDTSGAYLHDHKSMLYGDFLPGDPEQLVVRADDLVGIARANQSVDYRIHVQNLALETSFHFVASGLPAGYKGSMSPLEGSIAPNTTLDAILRITPPANAELKQIPFTLTLESGSGAEYDLGLFIEVVAADPKAPPPTTTTYSPDEEPFVPIDIIDQEPTGPVTTTTPPIISTSDKATPGLDLLPALLVVAALAIAIRRRLP